MTQYTYKNKRGHRHNSEKADINDENLDVAWSSVKSLNAVLSPLSMDRPRARNEGCSGLQNQKYFKRKGWEYVIKRMSQVLRKLFNEKSPLK